MNKRWNNAITDVPGIKVGHATHKEALTGCTVVLCEDGAVGGVDQRGGAPGTRETDSMKPMHLVQKAHAVVLAGGSAFGLEAATGVVRYLEERGIGYDTLVARVPIVPAAILFDLAIGDAAVRPDAAMGYAACQAADNAPPSTLLQAQDTASSGYRVVEGNVGAGTGATVGKIMGIQQAMKAGLGTASVDLGEGLVVGAIVAVNAFGDVIDPQTGQILAGARSLDGTGFADTLAVMKSLVSKTNPSTGSGHRLEFSGSKNTVIGVVATNAQLNKEEANKVAQMAQDGLARAVRPAHTMFDGDTLFALATGSNNEPSMEADVNTVGAYAAEVVAEAIVRAIKTAEGVAGLPAWRDLENLEKGG
jgi:L-aminopeptidase/D-esterase-like protein